MVFQKICIRIQNREPDGSHIFMSTLFHMRKTIQEYSNYNSLSTNNFKNGNICILMIVKIKISIMIIIKLVMVKIIYRD